MIPALVEIDPSVPWRVLPAGIHAATLQEVFDRYVVTAHRLSLFEGFLRGVTSLQSAGCGLVYLDGSFVSSKPVPDDFDACYDETGVVASQLHPALLKTQWPRTEQKAEFLGEFFPAQAFAAPLITYLDWFQNEKLSNKPKGIIAIRLSPSISRASP